LITGGINYRLGILQGRLKGIKNDENLIKLMMTTKK